MKKHLLTGLAACMFGAGLAQTSFFTKTCYRGAFAPAPTPMWTENWTEFDPQNKVYPAPTVTISADITTNTTWSTGQTILLTAPVFVKNNSVLTIQPGVVIRGAKASNGAALIITKGSQIIADGTVNNPIVFTSDQAPGQRDLGDWGGLILLGKSTNNNSGGVSNIEGLPINPDTEFGGGTSPDPNDNSGVLRYIRLEYCGYVYQPNQEINTLTMGSVGRATTIEYIQASFGNDDAFEWFGGTVNCKYLVSFRCLDDDFDTDLGYSGLVQFCLAVRDPDIADAPTVSTSSIFESDNDPGGTTATPKTSAIFSNVTAIGPKRGNPTSVVAAGHRRGARIRRNSELKIYNSVFIDNATRGLFIDGAASETNAQNGTLKFKNNILAGYGQRATESGTFGIITPNLNAWVIANANDTLLSSANILTTPYNYTAPDYRPSTGSIAMAGASFTDAALSAVTGTFASSVAATIPSTICIGDGITTSPAVFAPSTTLSPNYCSLTWSASAGVSISNTVDVSPTFTISTEGTFSVYLTVEDANGSQTAISSIVTNTCTDVSVKEIHNAIGSINLFPNPAKDAVTLVVNSHSATSLNVTVLDIAGKVVANPVQNLNLNNGENTVVIQTENLQNGIYFVTLVTSNGKETVKLVVNK